MGHLHVQNLLAAADTGFIHLANIVPLFVFMCLMPIVIVWRVRHLKNQLPDGVNPGVCGHCGHPAMDAQSLNCPICGRDLRQVGIRAQTGLPPGHKTFILGSVSLTGAAVLSMLIACLACMISLNFAKRYPVLTTPDFQQGLWIGVSAAACVIHLLAVLNWQRIARGLSRTRQTTFGLGLMAIFTMGLTAGGLFYINQLLRQALELLAKLPG